MIKIKMNNICPKCGVEFSQETLKYKGKNLRLEKRRIYECDKCHTKIKPIDNKGRKWLLLLMPMFILLVLVGWDVNLKYPLLWTLGAFLLFAIGSVLYATSVEYIEDKEDF